MHKDLKDEIGAKKWQAKHGQRLNHKHDKSSEEQNMSNPFSPFPRGTKHEQTIRGYEQKAEGQDNSNPPKGRNMSKRFEGMSKEQKYKLTIAQRSQGRNRSEELLGRTLAKVEL